VVGRVGLGIALLLVALSALARLGALPGSPHPFDVDDERNLPAAWSTLQLLLVAVAAAAVARRADRDRRTWWLVVAGLLYLALDEGLRLHERLIPPVRRALDPDRDTDLLTFAWVVPGAVAVAVVGLLAIGFLRRMEPVLRRDLLRAAALFLFAVLVLEVVGGALHDGSGDSLPYLVEVHVEELLEMWAVALAGAALLRHLRGTPRRHLGGTSRQHLRDTPPRHLRGTPRRHLHGST
jgi:hypothetical protein